VARGVSSPITAGTSLTTQARVTCESLTIPAAAQAIVGNATVINGSGQTGYLTIYPNGVPLATAVTDSTGKFTATVKVSGVTAGSRVIAAGGVLSTGPGVKYKTVTVTVS